MVVGHFRTPPKNAKQTVILNYKTTNMTLFKSNLYPSPFKVPDCLYDLTTFVVFSCVFMQQTYFSMSNTGAHAAEAPLLCSGFPDHQVTHWPQSRSDWGYRPMLLIQAQASHTLNVIQANILWQRESPYKIKIAVPFPNMKEKFKSRLENVDWNHFSILCSELQLESTKHSMYSLEICPLGSRKAHETILAPTVRWYQWASCFLEILFCGVNKLYYLERS